MSLRQRDIGAFTKPADSVRPDEYTASVNGQPVDRSGYLSAVVLAYVGDAEGTPTSFTVDVKLQDSDASGGTYADLTPAADYAVAQIAAANSLKWKKVDLSKAKQFIRAVATIAFVGGTSPNIAVACPIILGGADVLPTPTA